ncbi:hypothetical protein [Halodesulfovibrio sp.]|jgi:hypothetical protein|uniref:hypothetical protein n=1 Tax=Halodesulfovibrio sp. TaxID=1912772 RepID=UPI0025FD58FB|nr:hypothetical protein [Halodesulfovibrio sp.]MCT4534478.1 hypothetical protein [Halodesulfovibrio sp.]
MPSSTSPTTELSPKELKKKRKQEKLKAQAIAIGDWYIWIYVAYTVITGILACTGSTLLDSVPPTVLSSIGIALLVSDHYMLKQRDITPPHGGWIILVLPYLWKRCNILNKSKTPFWLVTIAVTILITMQVLLLYVLKNDYEAANSYMPAVGTRLLQTSDTPAPYHGAKCVSLSGFKDFSDGNIICILDNGKKIAFVPKINANGEEEISWTPYED